MGRRRDKVQTGKRRTVLQLDDTNAPRRDNYRGHYGYSSSRMDSTAFEQQNNKGANRLASLVGNYADSDDSAESEDDKTVEVPVDVLPPEPAEPKDAIDNEVASFLAEIDAISGDTSETPVKGNSDGDDSKTANGESKMAQDIPQPPTSFWQQCLDDDSQCYYYWHFDTNEVTWEVPAEFSQYLESLKAYEEDVKEGIETGRYKPASDPSEKQIDNEASTDDGKESNIDGQPEKVDCKNAASKTEKPVKSLVDYELTSPKIKPDNTHDAIDASSRQKKKKSEKLRKNVSETGDDESEVKIGPQMPSKSSEIKSFDKIVSSGKTKPNVEEVDMFLSHLESEMLQGSSHVDNKSDKVKHGKSSDHHRKETDREERKRSRKISDEHKDAAKKARAELLESVNSNIGSDPTDTLKQAEEPNGSPELPAALIKKYQKKNKGKKSSTTPCDGVVQESTAPSTPDDFDLDDIDRELEIALERKQAELRQMDEEEIVLENDEQCDIDKDDADNQLAKHEEDRAREMTLAEDEYEQRPDVITEADGFTDALSPKPEATNSNDDCTRFTESLANESEVVEKPLLSSNDQDATLADNSGDLAMDTKSPTARTTTDEEVDISKVIELTDMVMGKLDFLEISEQELSNLQVLLLSIQTRADDWNAGALSSDYYYSKLVETNQQLGQYELSAAPSGWECHWDRSYRRYFYLDKATGESQWDYPNVQEQQGSHEESVDIGEVENDDSEMKVNGATEGSKESGASSSSPRSETQKDSLSNNRSDDSRSPYRRRHRSRRYHKKHRKHKKRRDDSDSDMDSSESDYSSSDSSSSTSSSDIRDGPPLTPPSEQPESRLSETVSPTDMLDSQPPSLPDMRHPISSPLSHLQDDYQENDEGPPQLDKEPPPLPPSSVAPPPPVDNRSPPDPVPPPPPPPPSEPPPLNIHQPPPSMHLTSTSFHLGQPPPPSIGQPPPPGTEELFMSLAPPPPPPPELVTVEMNAADDEPIEEVEMEGDEEVRTTTAVPPGAVIARSPQLNIPQPAYEGSAVIARSPQTSADYLSQGIIARGPQLASYAESGVSESMLAQGTVAYADGVLSRGMQPSNLASTVSAPATAESNMTEPMIQQPVKEKKKKRDKSIANTNLAMKKRKVSSLVQKWQKVKKEVEQEEGMSDDDDRTGLVRQKIEEWRHEQMIGGASDNPNFTEISGDWREKVRLRKLQEGSRAKDDYT